MSNTVCLDYISAGGNRHSAASDWSKQSGLLAYGADQSIGIWKPLDETATGLRKLLHGHTDRVNAVSFLSHKNLGNLEYLVTGSANGEVILWVIDLGYDTWTLSAKVKSGDTAVNVLATFAGSNIVVSGSADTSITLWRIVDRSLHQIASIKTSPRFIPLALALGPFPDLDSEECLFLAAAGTRNEIFLFSLLSLSTEPKVALHATLTGHEGWIRSLSLTSVNDHELMLASASHDKYVRLWRFQSGEPNHAKRGADVDQITSSEQTLTAKIKTVSAGDVKYSVTFEALLLGHEDWVYSADWSSGLGPQKLLTASADGTLALWEPDPTSGIWVSELKLGEISGQKGATTATGSAGGFWKGMWSPDGQSVTCLGRTGSWRVWQYEADSRFWKQRTGTSGHTNSVNGLSWSPDGGYLLSTSSDQTTRLHAEWKRGSDSTWHEFSRPQIHGYDLNCVTTTGYHQFASGADEKLLRVFNEPKDIASMLQRMCRIKTSSDVSLPDTAAIPVLGLSNKSMGEPDDIVEAGPHRRDDSYGAANAVSDTSLSEIVEPPTEDLLARHTLWPEHEKLYGHGYEISGCAYNSGVLATACKASSVDHAVLRLYNANSDWREIKPALTAHSLTATRLVWSQYPEEYLLSVGRDRQWAVFKRIGDAEFKLAQANPKAHSRMILDAEWSPVGGKAFFATAGRDKTVKFWHDATHLSTNEQGSVCKFELSSTITRKSAVTAISFTCNFEESHAVLAIGEEDGSISLHAIHIDTLELKKSIDLDRDLCPSKSVNGLEWRPYSVSRDGDFLAVAGADGSVRILKLDVEKFCRYP